MRGVKYISGHKFAALGGESGVVYYKTDHIFSASLPHSKFILITHNSDLSADYLHSNILSNPNLVKWFATNVDYKHEKLHPIPIGIANPEWWCGDENIMMQASKINADRAELIYANFTIWSHVQSRQLCQNAMWRNGITLYNGGMSFLEHLAMMRKSYFVVCPIGNGIDTHRMWEALYMGCVPIVERTTHSMAFAPPNLPIMYIDDWLEFSPPTIDEYQRIINSCHSLEMLSFDYWESLILSTLNQNS